MRDIHQQLTFGEGFNPELSGYGLDDFACLGSQGGSVYENPGTEFLVVEGVDELFH